MRKHFTDVEIDQVLTNRRSDFSDEALINDFMRSEQPQHEIPMDFNVTAAIEAVTDHFRPERTLYPVHFPDLRYYPLNLKVSAEAPWTSRTFRFKPTYRNVDEESELPRLPKDEVDKLPHVDGHVLVHEYLRAKHAHGMIDDSNTSYHNLYNEIFGYNRPLIHQIKEGEAPFWKDGIPQTYHWNTLHARSHVVGADEPDKIRAVFGATKLLLMAELHFIWPLQATYLNTKRGRMLWGREMFRGGWKKLFEEMHRRGPPNTVLGIDWSEFDKRLLHQLITIVHRIWRTYFSFSRYEPTSIYPDANPRDQRRIERLWEWMCYAILHTPILLPNGQLWEWTRNGFGSGYQQTQLMDTFANAIMIYTCLIALGVNVRAKGFWARFQGDDSIIRFLEQMYRLYGPGFLDMFAATAKRYFNAKLSLKKSEISNMVSGMTVLSYPNMFGLSFRIEEDLLRHLFFPERPQDLGRLAASAMGLCQAAMGSSTRFHNLCKDVWTRLVVKKDVKPKWKALRWMVRAGYVDTIEALQRTEFPDELELRQRAWIWIPRTEQEKQRQWPTEEGPRNRFYFLFPLDE
jgi:hypothetical protein